MAKSFNTSYYVLANLPFISPGFAQRIVPHIAVTSTHMLRFGLCGHMEMAELGRWVKSVDAELSPST